jgi:hypothetical protein
MSEQFQTTVGLFHREVNPSELRHHQKTAGLPLGKNITKMILKTRNLALSFNRH